MSLAEEVSRIAGIIQSKFTDAVVHRYGESSPVTAGHFAVLLKQETRRSETQSYTLIDREYTVICYGETAEESVLRMESLSRFTMNERADMMKIGSFTYGAAERTEDGAFKCTGTIGVQTRETIVREITEKMNQIAIRLKMN